MARQRIRGSFTTCFPPQRSTWNFSALKTHEGFRQRWVWLPSGVYLFLVLTVWSAFPALAQELKVPLSMKPLQ